MNTNDPAASNNLVFQVIDSLDRIAIPYMLVGSYSSNIYGVVRATQDADFVLQLGDRSLPAVMRLLGPDFHLDPQMSFETVTATQRYVILHQNSGFKIELFLLSDDPHDKERFARRANAAFAGHAITLPTPEDVIITKLRWSKGGNRRKDVEDVENVIAVQGNALDLAYIRQWTDQHGTRGLFEQLLVSAG
ncbi:MAG: hypothetical protein ACHRHE_14150 [Tepidisphaerales bacterium]